jgi:hypothetical protein
MMVVNQHGHVPGDTDYVLDAFDVPNIFHEEVHDMAGTW